MTTLLGGFLHRRTDDARAATSRNIRYRGQSDWNKETMWAQIAQHYEVGSFINSGRDGTILRRARHLDEDSSYALKIIPVEDPKVRANEKQRERESARLSYSLLTPQ